MAAVRWGIGVASAYSVEVWVQGGVVSSFEIWRWGLGVCSSLPLLSFAVAHRRFAGLVCEVAFWGRGCPGE